MLQIPAKEIASLWFSRAGPLKEITFAKLYQSYFARDVTFDDKCKTYEPHIDALLSHYNRQTLPALDPFNPLIENDVDVSVFPDTKQETLGQILLLDQFTRNIWRGQEAVRVYKEADPIAHQLSIYALQKKWDIDSDWLETLFMTMPLTHAEHMPSHIKLMQCYLAKLEQVEKAVTAGDKTAKERSVALAGLKSQLDHLEVISSFGRFPHRNAILGRTPTPEEKAYMSSGGKTFGTEE